MAKTKKKKRKLKRKKILNTLIILIILSSVFYYIYNLKITSITVKGNTLYTEWEIIKLAKLDNYPSAIQNLPGLVENRLEKDSYIKKAKIKTNLITNFTIEIEENLPLFYYAPEQKTILADKTKVKDNFSVPTLVNYVPDKTYEKFLKEITDIDYTILKRISEIKYDPNEVDEERFLLTMNDGNYVYLTISKFDKINHYLDIIKEFNNKKGILYLDSGEYFKVIN